MRILLTGCAGFIGHKTAEYLLNDGIDVIGIDNLNDYYDIRLKEWRLKQLEKIDNFTFYKIDIEDYNKVNDVFEKENIDAVINLAARAGVRYSIENPHVYFTTNVNGTLNLLEIMRKRSIKKMILASTSSLNAGQKMPFNERLAVNKPISPYAASKKAAEVLCYTYHYLFGFDISVLRYFTVYGPAGRPDMSYFRFIKWIDNTEIVELFGDGYQARDFTYIDDIARGTIKALKDVGYEIINLGGGKNPISINYMINKIEQYLGKKANVNNRQFHKADMKETWAEIKKAKKILDWKPEIRFEEGLKKTVDWYLENKEWIKDLEI